MIFARYFFAFVSMALAFAQSPGLNAQDKIEKLIDQLAEVKSPDTGYGQYFSGTNFLPYEDSEQLGTMIIGATARQRSPAMKKIVEAGFDAIPELLKHLDDKRKVKLPKIESGGMMWISFDNEYDFNSATINKIPKGVNIDGSDNGSDQPDHHEMTVGDLCFVALGQIVNRHWSACRYQPTGGRIISSPTYSVQLRKAILDEWGNLDRQEHKKKLIEDFRNPDSEYRMVGAYQRLSLYYPDVVEKLVLEFLNRPIPSSDKTSELAGRLLEIKDVAERERKLKTILEENGKHYRDAIQNELFNEIRYSDSGAMEKRVLHETFGWTKQGTNVIRKERIKLSLDEYETARFIRALTHDQSQLIGNRIQKILESDRFKDDSYMVEACLISLASRKKFGNYLAERLKKTDFRKATRKSFPSKYLSAIAKSESPGVKEQLQQIAKISSDPDLFLIAANAITRDSWKPIVKRARKILDDLPADTRNGRQLLSMILKKSPDEAESILKEFLKPNTPSRCNTVCEVLWYNEPLSQKLLLPMLDDEREIPGVTVRIRDRAATAISHSIPSIRYDSDWSEPQRADAIRRIKQYCQNK